MQQRAQVGRSEEELIDAAEDISAYPELRGANGQRLSTGRRPTQGLVVFIAVVFWFGRGALVGTLRLRVGSVVGGVETLKEGVVDYRHNRIAIPAVARIDRRESGSCVSRERSQSGRPGAPREDATAGGSLS